MMQTLNTEHYQPQEVNDKLSSKVFESYLKVLDFQRRFFTKQDLAQFEKFKTQVDDEIRDGKFEFYSTVSQTYRKRLSQVAGAYEAYLSKPFD